MSTLLVKGGFYFWKDLIPFLISNLNNQDPSVIENSLQALSIIVEDTEKLFEDEKFHKLVEEMGSKIFKLLD